MTVKLGGRLPADNGLAGLASLLEENAFTTLPVVGVLILSKRVSKFDSPDDPLDHVLRIVSIEALKPGSRQHKSMLKMLEQALSERTGVIRLFGEDDGGATDG